jgi:hypothetical protein
MRGFIQASCVVAIALGAGLFTFGSYLQPRLDLANPAGAAQVARYFGKQSEDLHIAAAIARGFGTGFMTLGGLGLVVPWVNAFLAHQRVRGSTMLPNADPAV